MKLSLATAIAGLALGSVSVAAPAPGATGPQYQSTGEQSRTYRFPGTDEEIAFHLYVPSNWNKASKLPLVVVTHGAGQPAVAPFQRPMDAPTLAKTAEARGYIVVAVTGYHANATGVGGWNVPYKMVTIPRPPNPNAPPPATPAPAPPTDADFQRAEQDVLLVGDLVAKEYNVPPQRRYLMGNSSGGSAVWAYAAKYPDRWAAISPSAAPLEDANFPYEKLKDVPVLVVHGDKDNVMNFDASRAMTEHARAKGVDATWLPVQGGAHTDAWAQPAVIAQIFDFFDAHRGQEKK